MEIPCKYEDYYFVNGRSYSCKFSDQFIPKNAIIKPIGRYIIDDLYEFDYRRKKADVHAVIFTKCRLSKVPQGLTKIFPNMKILSIWNSTLKNVHKNDLVEYKNLERIGFCNNLIEFVRGDLFEGFENLNEVSIYGNAIKLIEPNILDGLDKLDYVSLGGEKYSISNFKANDIESLDKVKNDLIIQYYKNHKDIKNFRKIDNENKEYKIEIQKLIEENKNLQKQVCDKNVEISRIKSKLNAENDPKDIQSQVKQLFEDETFKDFSIQINDREFLVHKFLLAARSSTLAEIFKNNPEVENLNLVDISVEIFEIIMKFLYTDELPDGDGIDFLKLFVSAGKLKIQLLKEFAATKLIDHIDENNALDILKLSNKYENEELMHASYEVLRNAFPKIIFEDDWVADVEKVTKIIEAFKMKEELINKVEKDFQELMLKSKNLM